MSLKLNKLHIGETGASAALSTFLNQMGFLCTPYQMGKRDQYDAVLFGGGADVHPDMYGDSRHKSTNINPSRDEADKRVFEECASVGIPMVGICRGAQFLTVMSGGRLFQDVTGHKEKHFITLTGFQHDILVSSTHHQMMYPYCAPFFEVVGWAKGISSRYDTGSLSIKPKAKQEAGKTYVVEPEVVWYPHTQSLAIQYHPEYSQTTSKAATSFVALFYRYIVG